MLRRVLLVAVCLLPGCKCNGKKAASHAAPDARAVTTAPEKPRIPKATEPDPDYEARRDELLRRGNPDVMQRAPIYGEVPPEASATDLVKAVSKDVMMVKSIKVDLARHRAEIPGKVATRGQMLEFIAVGAGGKEYESLFTVDATAVELRLALTLLGHEGVAPDDKGDVPAPKAGESMRVLVRVGDDERPLSAFLLDRGTNKAPADLAFQVVGFRDADKGLALGNPQFVSLVTHELYAPLRAVTPSANPYAGPDKGLISSPRVPEKGAAVTLILEDIAK